MGVARWLTVEEAELPDLDAALTRAVQIVEAEHLLRPNITITCMSLVSPRFDEPEYDYSVVVKGAVTGE